MDKSASNDIVNVNEFKTNQENVAESGTVSVLASSTVQSDTSESVDEFQNSIVYKKLVEIFDEYLLNEIQRIAAFKFIKTKFTDLECTDVNNLKKWILMRVNNKLQPDNIHHMQRGCCDIVPGLRIQAWWDPSEFSWIGKLIENFKVIQEELISLRENKGFQPYKSPKFVSNIESDDKIGAYGHDSGSWNVFYLFLHDMKFDENCKKCPKTVELIDQLVPRQYHHAFFSAVAPGTHIVDHNGPTNRKLRLHIPLLNVTGTRLRVGEETKHLEEGKPIIFDDSFNHEAWHDGDKTRINLIIDFWHPDLSDAEVKFFKMLQQSKLRHGKKILELFGKGADDDNYFEIIERSKELLKDNDWWIN